MRFFFYGTLMRPERAPNRIAPALLGARPVGTGRVPGWLYDLGAYPGAIPDPAAPAAIVGEVFELPEQPARLAAIDAYEEFDPERPASSPYRRVSVEVTLEGGGSCVGWMYVLNRPMDGWVPLNAEGDRRWMNGEGQERGDADDGV